MIPFVPGQNYRSCFDNGVENTALADGYFFCFFQNNGTLIYFKSRGRSTITRQDLAAVRGLFRSHHRYPPTPHPMGFPGFVC